MARKAWHAAEERGDRGGRSQILRREGGMEVPGGREVWWWEMRAGRGRVCRAPVLQNQQEFKSHHNQVQPNLICLPTRTRVLVLLGGEGGKRGQV